jgi:hypothetical protein
MGVEQVASSVAWNVEKILSKACSMYRSTLDKTALYEFPGRSDVVIIVLIRLTEEPHVHSLGYGQVSPDEQAQHGLYNLHLLILGQQCARTQAFLISSLPHDVVHGV